MFEIGEEIPGAGAGPEERSLKWWKERVDALEKEADQNMVDEDDNDANIVEVDGGHEDESAGYGRIRTGGVADGRAQPWEEPNLYPTRGGQSHAACNHGPGCRGRIGRAR